jgi:hypothetical protein
MEAVALTFGLTGFVFGLMAFTQLIQLRKEVKELREKIDGAED